MSANAQTEQTAYVPFILLDGEYRSLFMSEDDMLDKRHVFAEFEDEGWNGNGYDWESIAQLILEEQLFDLEEDITFDSEAAMFSATGPRSALAMLGRAMQAVYHDEDILRDMIRRAAAG